MDRLRLPLLLAVVTSTVVVVALATTGDDPAPSTATTTADDHADDRSGADARPDGAADVGYDPTAALDGGGTGRR